LGPTRFPVAPIQPLSHLSRKHSKKDGGERGIRTPGTLAGTAVFETAPFNQLWHLSVLAFSSAGARRQASMNEGAGQRPGGKSWRRLNFPLREALPHVPNEFGARALSLSLPDLFVPPISFVQGEIRRGVLHRRARHVEGIAMTRESYAFDEGGFNSRVRSPDAYETTP
jgi:hypothetical protein